MQHTFVIVCLIVAAASFGLAALGVGRQVSTQALEEPHGRHRCVAHQPRRVRTARVRAERSRAVALTRLPLEQDQHTRR